MRKVLLLFPFIAFALCGCSAIMPADPPDLWEALSGTEDNIGLPSVQELEVTVGSAVSETFVQESDEDETLFDYYLSPDDVNWCYEAALKSGDFSDLDDKQKQVLHSVIPVIESCSQLSTYDQIIYIHDYLTSTVVYGFLSNPYSEYGALVEHTAVCQGYAYAFKLCMDLLEIPCITVGGSADNGSGDISHAWNMVELSGEWYHVDVTWDDAVTTSDHGNWCHLYFLVDDDFMKQNHQWTDLVQGVSGISEIPEASDMSMFYFNVAGKLLDSQEMLRECFADDFSEGIKKMEYCCRGFVPDTAFIGNYSSGEIVYQSVGEYVILYISLE